MRCWECGQDGTHLAHCPQLVGEVIPGSCTARVLAYLLVASNHEPLDRLLRPDRPRKVVGPLGVHPNLFQPLTSYPGAWFPDPRGVDLGLVAQQMSDPRDRSPFVHAINELRRKGFISLIAGLCPNCDHEHFICVLHWNCSHRWPALTDVGAQRVAHPEHIDG